MIKDIRIKKHWTDIKGWWRLETLDFAYEWYILKDEEGISESDFFTFGEFIDYYYKKSKYNKIY